MSYAATKAYVEPTAPGDSASMREESRGQTEPVPADPAQGGAVCACGAGPHPELLGRCAAGHVAHGNALAHQHGLWASELAEALAEERQAFVAASLADDGGEAEVPTRRRSLHEYRGRLHVHISQLSGAIERHGLFDKRGRLRAAWLQRLEGLIDRARSIDATLGLDRGARRVNFQERLVASFAEKNKRGAEVKP